MNAKLVIALRKGRKKMNLKQADVAEQVGLNGKTISGYESGISEPRIDTFFQLCKIYELDVISMLKEAYGLDLQTVAFPMSSAEKELIGKYRGLDEHGREIVDLILQKELERVVK